MKDPDNLLNNTKNLHGPLSQERLKEELTGYRISLPQTQFERMIQVATIIPRVLLAVLQDLLQLILAGSVTIAELCGANYNPSHPNADAIPNGAFHGSGFHKGQWAIWHLLLGRKHTYSVSYAEGILSNDPKTSITAYAKSEKVVNFIKTIRGKHKTKKINLKGHSMGGLVALEVARLIRNKDAAYAHIDVEIENVFLYNCPIRGTPTLDLLPNENKAQRYKDMSINSEYRHNLMKESLKAERQGKLRIHCAYSTTDFAVPNYSGKCGSNPKRRREFSYHGHFTAATSLRILWQDIVWNREIAARDNRSKQPKLIEQQEKQIAIKI